MVLKPEERQYLLSLNASKLTEEQVEAIVDLLLELDPTCGPKPKTPKGRRVVAEMYLRYLHQHQAGVMRGEVDRDKMTPLERLEHLKPDEITGGPDGHLYVGLRGGGYRRL